MEVSYINKGGHSPLSSSSSGGPIPAVLVTGHSSQCQTHSWLSQCDSRPNAQAQAIDNHGMESPSQDPRCLKIQMPLVHPK